MNLLRKIINLKNNILKPNKKEINKMDLLLEPLFDVNGNFVGWLVNNENVFDSSLKWVAYIFNNYVWSSKTTNWIGILRGSTLLDRKGNIVAWSTSQPPIGGLNDILPPNPVLPPIPPAPPLIDDVPLNPGYSPTPLGKWSKLTFTQWLNQP